MIQMRACIDVDELEKAVIFYTHALDLKVGRRFDSAWVELIGASSALDLLASPSGSEAYPGASARRDYARHWTPVHLDFVVEDLDAAVKRAQEAGATLDREIQTRPYGRMANLADPFGHGICLLELRGRGYDEIAQG